MVYFFCCLSKKYESKSVITITIVVDIENNILVRIAVDDLHKNVKMHNADDAYTVSTTSRTATIPEHGFIRFFFQHFVVCDSNDSNIFHWALASQVLSDKTPTKFTCPNQWCQNIILLFRSWVNWHFYIQHWCYKFYAIDIVSFLKHFDVNGGETK